MDIPGIDIPSPGDIIGGIGGFFGGLAEDAGRAIIELVLAVIFGFVADAVAAMATQAVFGDERADDGMIPGGVALACVRIARVAAVRGVGRRIGARVPVRGRRAPVVSARDEKEGEEATEGAKVETRHGRSLGWRSVRVVHYPIGRLSQSSPPFWGRLVAVCYCRVAR